MPDNIVSCDLDLRSMKVGRVDIVAEVELVTYAESSNTGIGQVAVG